MRLASLLVILGTCLSIDALACSCGGPSGSFEEQVEHAAQQADAIYLAKAVHVEETRIQQQRPASTGVTGTGKPVDIPEQIFDLEAEITTFEVEHTWKGPDKKVVQTRIVTSCCMCGLSYRPGTTYLLYLYGPDRNGYLETSVCSRGGSDAEALRDRPVLNRLFDDPRRRQHN